MRKVEVVSFLKYFRYLLAVSFLNFCIVSVQAQLPYSQSFKNATASDLIISGLAGDAFLTAGSIDPAGQGYLRLTNNLNYQSGYVRNSTSFPSENGLSISFDYFTYGGTGADGISFFLFDAAASPFNIGTFGGSLGYAQNSDLPGVSKGFIALGLDEFGNFSNPNAGRQGGPGRIASSVVLRGDGNGIGPGIPSGTNYEFLTGISTNNTSAMTIAGAGGIFQVAGGVNGRTVTDGMGSLHTGYRRAKMDLTPNGLGSGFIVNVWITEGSSGGAIVHHVIKNYSYIPTGPIPANLKYGFSAGTGSASNFHEIRNIEILKPINQSTVPKIADLNLEGTENIAYSFSQSDFISKFTHFSLGSLSKIKILNLPLHGTLKLNGAHVSAGQEINISDVSKLKFIPELDFIGTTNFQWNGSDGSSYALSDAFVKLNITALTPTLPYSESFKNATSSGLIVSSTSNSAELTAGIIDPSTGGYLRLTKNQINQTGYVYNTKNFPSENGLLISFDYYSHGGTGSDGINFFLYDAAANPFTIGAFGGALGYAQSYTSNGLSKGFIGLGLDDYGNFSSPGSGRQGGPGRMPGSVSLRGDGDGRSLLPSNFEYLKHAQTSNIADMTGAGGIFELFGNKDSRTAGIAGLGPLDGGYRKVKMELVPNGFRTGYLVNVWITEGNTAGAIVHHVIKDFSYISTEQIPANLRYGFSASTGSSKTVYEVRNLEILLPSNLDHKPVATNISKTGNEDQTIVFQNSDFQNSFFDPKGYNTLMRVQFISLPQINEGVLKLNGNAITPLQAIYSADISTGKLSFTPAPNFHGIVSSFKWQGATSSNNTSLPDHVFITINSVNDAPSGTDKEIVLSVNESGRVLNVSDLGFTDANDANLNTFEGIKIASVPGLGNLKLNNIKVTVGQFIPVDAISSGLLSFTPGKNEFGKPYATFSFQVKDNGGQVNGGIDLDQSPNILTIIVHPLPSIELVSANSSICVGSESATMKYNAVNGDPLPNIFNINWSNAAKAAGLVDITNKVLVPGIISIDGLLNLPSGNYQGTLTVRNSSNLILSAGLPISILVKPLIIANISYGVNAFCNSGKVDVSLVGDLGGKFTSSAGLVLNELSGEVDLSSSTPGNYVVTYSLSNGACSLITSSSLVISSLPVISNITGVESLLVGSTSQLNSGTNGGIWSSNNKSIASVNSTGLVKGLKQGTAQIIYKVSNGICTDSVSVQVNISSLKAGDMVKIMNENKSISFSSIEFYNLIDSVSRANDPTGTLIAKIMIKSLPLNGVLKLNGKQISSEEEIFYNEISGLAYTPFTNFSGTDIFKWNWADASGKYGNHVSGVTISTISNSSLFQYSVNENEVFKGQTSVTNRIDFELGGVDAAALEINSSTGAISMKSRDYEFPADANSDNKYDFNISSKDARGNSYTENWKLIVQNVTEYAQLSIEHLANEEIAENLNYTSPSPRIIGRPIGKVIYTLKGNDSSLFTIDSLSGIVSMEAKDFESASDFNKDNVYDVEIKATDSDLNTAMVSWKVRVTNVLEVSQITLVSVSDMTIEENKIYSSAAPVLNGKSVGKLIFILTGKDSTLFKIDTAIGVVSMEGKDFESASDSDKDNVYEVGVLAMDSDMNSAKVSWKVSVSDVQEVSSFSLLAYNNVNVEENTNYSSSAAVLIGKPIGKVFYSLTGKDSTMFKIDTESGIVSMEGRDFESSSDSDKDNVYEIGLKATDSDLNTSGISWNINIVNVKELSSIRLLTISDMKLDEKKMYYSAIPVLDGNPIGKLTYSKSGRDSSFFQVDKSTGIVSMQSKDFDYPQDFDKDNSYEICLIAKDSDGNRAIAEWKILVQLINPSAAHSMLTPEVNSIPLTKNSSQIVTLTSKYANGDRYKRGGQTVLMSKVSGSGTIGSVRDHGDGTYSAIVQPDTTGGSGIFIASLAGEEVRNGTIFQSKSTINFMPSTDASLKSFTLSKGILSPQFKPEISDYITTVEYSVDSISLSPVVNEEHAKIVINGIKVPAQNSGIKIPLTVGSNRIEIIVLAQDGIKKQIYNLVLNRSDAIFPYRESFMTDTVKGLVFGGATNTARLTSGSFDVSGKGYLQLNRNRLNESGFVHNSQKFPSEKGLSISFEYFTYGGTGGDGLSFFLFDAKASFKIGAFGGSLGYAQNSSNSGLNSGFIGLGLDEFGEFSNTSSNKQGGPGRRASSVVIRGDGNGIGSGNPSRSNYEYLTGMQTRDASAMKLAGAGNIFFISGMQDGRTAPGGSLGPEETGYRKVKMQMLPNVIGSGFVVNVWITEGSTSGAIVHHVIKNHVYIPTDGIPVDLKYGFAAGSGTSTNYHEIRNLEITLPIVDATSTLPIVDIASVNDNVINSSVNPLPTNLITPNGDGINDTWIVRNIELFPNNKVRIFNSSGREVYAKNNYNNEWDGKMAGISLPLGTYYYIFEKGNSATPYKGYVTIHH
jgi:gliding motility-associated-like protein